MSFLLPLLCSAQNEAKPESAPPTAAEIQQQVREWVRIQELTLEEQSSWKEEQRWLEALNDLRLAEMEELETSISAAGERLVELEARTTSLDSETVQLREDRGVVVAQVAALEDRLRPLLPLFPASLKGKLSDALSRLESAHEDVPLQNRVRDLTAIALEANAFDSRLTVESELRTVKDEEREVEVLYLGFGQAFCVDPNGSYAAVGMPQETGWEWSASPGLASSIRQAIAIHEKEVPPAL
ncbi:MAG: DUF3450 family protein, partial [Verrucomicrobiota bacterium]